MDYEKAYNEAIEKIRNGLQPLSDGAKISGVTRAFLEEVFPELKESEDERIRRNIIAALKGEGYYDCDLTNECIAWLEKQGEQKVPINDFKAKNWYVSEVDGKIHDMTYNPADKVEPKFHEGDWIIDKQGIVHQIEKVIENVTNNTFGYDLVGGGYFNEEVKSHRLWTIADAKDGNVLACGDKVTDCPFIFHNLTEELNPRSYCGVNTSGDFQYNDENGGFWCKSDEVRPATKEQRDLLFQKMKEEGYQWNPDKKELKKIEQKPTWSEEDEEYLRRAINATKDGYPMTTKWLKSLKEKLS